MYVGGINLRPVYTYADLFCGAGGLSHGFNRHKGFRHLLAVDYWQAAADTYTANNPNASFHVADLQEPQQQTAVIDRLKNRCDVLLGGPPCQSFSTLGKRRDNDRRSSLVDVFLDIAAAVRPRVFLMENVRGITSMKHASGELFPAAIERRMAAGPRDRSFSIVSGYINALDYGLAQSRIRWIAVGARNDRGGVALATRIFRGIEQAGSQQVATLRDAIGDLPRIAAGGGADELVQGRGKSATVIFNHRALAHSDQLLRRFAHVPPGGGLLDVPRRLLTPHLRKMIDGHYGNGGHIKNIYGRLEWGKPAGTVVAGIDKITCGRFLHPDADRLLTPRECARLQSFPDSFRFHGSMVKCYYLIGNAVPPRFSEVFACAIRKGLAAADSTSRVA